MGRATNPPTSGWIALRCSSRRNLGRTTNPSTEGEFTQRCGSLGVIRICSYLRHLKIWESLFPKRAPQGGAKCTSYDRRVADPAALGDCMALRLALTQERP